MQTHSTRISLFKKAQGVTTPQQSLDATAAHVDSHIEAIRHTLRVVLEDLMEAEVAPTNLETLIAALLCNGVTAQEIAFLFAESSPILTPAPHVSTTLFHRENLTLA
ncbi:hypothetical protein EON83_22925 [bacterium]|nr:MAG: hypothetical protein EON83_22925 [bacterium]